MISILLMTVLLGATSQNEAGWSDEVVVRQGFEPVVKIQARVQDGYLIVRLKHEAGWHTYAMDNETRAAAALQGKPSLGVEQGLSFEVKSGLDLEDRWLQTGPTDLSKPELRWFTYGFDETAWFACPVRKIQSRYVVLHVRGQACSGETCCQIDEMLEFPSQDAVGEKLSAEKSASADSEKIRRLLSRLVPVAAKQPEPDESKPGS